MRDSGQEDEPDGDATGGEMRYLLLALILGLGGACADGSVGENPSISDFSDGPEPPAEGIDGSCLLVFNVDVVASSFLAAILSLNA